MIKSSVLIAKAAEYKGYVWLSSVPLVEFYSSLKLERTSVFHGKHWRKQLSDGLRSYSSF